MDATNVVDEPSIAPRSGSRAPLACLHDKYRVTVELYKATRDGYHDPVRVLDFTGPTHSAGVLMREQGDAMAPGLWRRIFRRNRGSLG